MEKKPLNISEFTKEEWNKLEQELIGKICNFWGITQEDLSRFKPPQVYVFEKDDPEIEQIGRLKYIDGGYSPAHHNIVLIEKNILDMSALKIVLTEELTHSLYDYFRPKGILERLFKRYRFYPPEELIAAVTVMALNEESKKRYRDIVKSYKEIIKVEKEFERRCRKPIEKVYKELHKNAVKKDQKARQEEKIKSLNFGIRI